MHHFVAETSQLEIGSVAVFLKRAEAIYDENLSAYVKIVLRRPFMKIIVSGVTCLLISLWNQILGLFRRCGTPIDDNCPQ